MNDAHEITAMMDAAGLDINALWGVMEDVVCGDNTSTPLHSRLDEMITSDDARDDLYHDVAHVIGTCSYSDTGCPTNSAG